MLDPAIHLITASGFALLLVTAGWHKLNNRRQFEGILRNYRLLPDFAAVWAAPGLALAESGLGIAWVTGWQPVKVAIATALLLTLYAGAMAINIGRGRSYIDCGCGFTTTGKPAVNDNSVQQITPGLVWRNLSLSGIALLSILPASNRVMGWFDYVGVITACVTLVLLYGTFNQLLINRNAINSWRIDSGAETRGMVETIAKVMLKTMAKVMAKTTAKGTAGGGANG